MNLTDDELAELIRTNLALVLEAGPESPSLDEVANLFRANGIVKNMNMGDKASESRRAAMEWYAGQFLDIVESKAFFAMNSYLNSAEKYTGPLDLSDPE